MLPSRALGARWAMGVPAGLVILHWADLQLPAVAPQMAQVKPHGQGTHGRIAKLPSSGYQLLIGPFFLKASRVLIPSSTNLARPGESHRGTQSTLEHSGWQVRDPNSPHIQIKDCSQKPPPWSCFSKWDQMYPAAAGAQGHVGVHPGGPTEYRPGRRHSQAHQRGTP